MATSLAGPILFTQSVGNVGRCQHITISLVDSDIVQLSSGRRLNFKRSLLTSVGEAAKKGVNVDIIYMAGVLSRDAERPHFHFLYLFSGPISTKKKEICKLLRLSSSRQVQPSSVRLKHKDFYDTLRYLLVQGVGIVSDNENVEETVLKRWPKSQGDVDIIEGYAYKRADEFFPGTAENAASGSKKTSSKAGFISSLLEVFKTGTVLSDISNNLDHSLYPVYVIHSGIATKVWSDFQRKTKVKTRVRLVFEEIVFLDTNWRLEREEVGGLGFTIPKKKRHLYVEGKSDSGKTTFISMLKFKGWDVDYVDTRGTVTMTDPDFVVFDDWKSVNFSLISKITQGGAQMEDQQYRQRIVYPDNVIVIILSNVNYKNVIKVSDDKEWNAFENRFNIIKLEEGYLSEFAVHGATSDESVGDDDDSEKEGHK